MNLWLDSVWIVDSTPVEYVRSRESARRSDLAGWANSSHRRSLLLIPADKGYIAVELDRFPAARSISRRRRGDGRRMPPGGASAPVQVTFDLRSA